MDPSRTKDFLDFLLLPSSLPSVFRAFLSSSSRAMRVARRRLSDFPRGRLVHPRGKFISPFHLLRDLEPRRPFATSRRVLRLRRLFPPGRKVSFATWWALRRLGAAIVNFSS